VKPHTHVSKFQQGKIITFGEVLVIVGQLHEKYVGCFEENDVDQRWALALNNRNDLTVDICVQKCYQLNTTFAALLVSSHQDFMLLALIELTMA